MILDLGCGSRKVAGSIGVDMNPQSRADVIHDLSERPYPFDEGVASEIHLDNVLERLVDVIAPMEEIHRFASPLALVTLHVPYFRSRWAAVDPTHLHVFM